MTADDHDRLILAAKQWERLYGELFVKAQRLTIERDELQAALDTISVEAAALVEHWDTGERRQGWTFDDRIQALREAVSKADALTGDETPA